MIYIIRGLVFGLLLALPASDVAAQNKSSGSSKSTSSSTSSKPKYTAPSPAPKPSPLVKAEPPRAEKPKYTAPSPKIEPQRPTTKSEPAEKPKYTAPPTRPSETKAAEKPKYTPVAPPSNSFKPDSRPVSDKARASKEDRSERKYLETQKAVAPPKAKYTSPEGKEVAVRTATKDAEAIRSLPSASVTPEARRQNVTVHVHQHGYRHDYNWYSTQPVVYVGGGYSSAFWWMMAEWDAERRARWLYNHRHTIEHDAYERGMRDAQVAAAVNRLEDQRAYRDPNYVDPEFRSNPAACYTDDYVEAVYNPPVVHYEPTDPGSALAWLGAILLIGLVGCGIYVLCFKVRWGS